MPKSPRPQPAFRQVWSDLRTQILSDAFAADKALPTEVQLAEEYAVSRQTIRRAFHDLVSEGLVIRVPGRGTFAVPLSGRYIRQFGSIDDLMALSADSQLRVLTPLSTVVDPIAASRLRLSDDLVVRVVFVRIHKGGAFSHTVVSLPPDVGGRLGAIPELEAEGSTSPATVIGLLDSKLDQPIRDADQSITVVSASDEVSTSLDLVMGTKLLRIDRMYFGGVGEPIELAVSHFHPDRYSYRVRLRRSLP